MRKVPLCSVLADTAVMDEIRNSRETLGAARSSPGNESLDVLLAGPRRHLSGLITRWRKTNAEFCGTIKKAEAQRLKDRLARIEGGEAGWQGTAWALERIYPKRFSRPDIQLAQQINVDTNSSEELIVDTKLLEGRPGIPSEGHARPWSPLKRKAR
jgi:hypothetical protein